MRLTAAPKLLQPLHVSQPEWREHFASALTCARPAQWDHSPLARSRSNQADTTAQLKQVPQASRSTNPCGDHARVVANEGGWTDLAIITIVELVHGAAGCEWTCGELEAGRVNLRACDAALITNLAHSLRRPDLESPIRCDCAIADQIKTTTKHINFFFWLREGILEEEEENKIDFPRTHRIDPPPPAALAMRCVRLKLKRENKSTWGLLACVPGAQCCRGLEPTSPSLLT